MPGNPGPPAAPPPEGTDAPFLLLLVAALALVANLSLPLRLVFLPEEARDAPISASAAPTADENGEFFAATRERQSRVSREALATLGPPALAITALLLGAGFWHRRHPRRLTSRHGLRPFEAARDPELHRQVLLLAAESGLRPAPSLWLGPSFKGQGAQAFGTSPPFALRLDGGLRVMLRKDRPALLAIVRHECAHLAANDVRRAYRARALWLAAFWLTLVPLALALGWVLLSGGRSGGAFGSYLDFVARSAATLAAVTLIWAGLLRVREIEADARAASLGSRSDLIRLLSAAARPEGGWRTRLRHLGKFHPDPALRLAALRDPFLRFRWRPWLPLAGGFLNGLLAGGGGLLVLPLALAAGSALHSAAAAAAAAEHASRTLALTAASGLLTTLPPLAAIGFLGWLLARTTGDPRLRAHRLCPAPPPARCLASALLLALGFELGCRIAPFSILAPSDPATVAKSLLGTALWAAFACAILTVQESILRRWLHGRRRITCLLALLWTVSLIPLLVWRFALLVAD